MIRFIRWSFLLLFGLVACKEEAGPTTFQGAVIYADNNAPFLSGYIEFTARGTGSGGKVVESRQLPLDMNNGIFETIFDPNEDIVNFIIEVSDTVFFERIGSEQGLDCGLIPCEGISPGNNFSDLIIKVPR